jgi:hypothetical protein
VSREDLDVPASVRAEVLERDGQCCRVCGRFVEQPALHHIVFRSQGGLHVPGNLVTIGWIGEHDCHLRLAHGRDAAKWRELLQQVVVMPGGVTCLALARWQLRSRNGRSQNAP